MQIGLLLHNIRSAHNVGSLFRSADGAGVAHVFLSGYTPTPLDKFQRAQKDIAKTALGAEKKIPWSSHKNASSLIKNLKTEGWHIVGIEQDSKAVDYRALHLKPKTLFVLGNEVRGISPELRRICDTLIEIPMHGSKESLNVSVAGAVVLFAHAH